MKLQDLIKIDNRFEKSVNLLLDLHVQEKVDSYIPTRSSVKILGEYTHEILHFSGERASVLIGPYGKGKSHLLLVLLSFLSQSGQMSVLNSLQDRIAAVDPAVADEIKAIMSQKGPFLPVIINTSTGTLSQAFTKGLTNALIRDGLTDIVPDNYFSEAVKMIEHWKEAYPATFSAFEERLVPKTANEFVEELVRFDEDALCFFRAVYPELTSGSIFNPNVDDEVISVYRSTNRRLREKYDYAGIYIVFDEFSKYIEGHAVERFAEDMKVLQDMCELCNASKEEQLHLTCVAHKSIKSYGDSLPAEILNAYKGVEGRLKETYFVVSSKNNYELISNAITKTPSFKKWAQNAPEYKLLLENAYSLKAFSSLFTLDDYMNIVGEGCFPLSPVTAMLLLNLSEKIAQNERTIFTYITSRDKFGLAREIESRSEPEFIGIDSVYDYFVPLLREDATTNVHHEWLKAEYALSQTTSAQEQAIIKCIAIIRMANTQDDIVTTEKHIALAAGIELDTCHQLIEALVHKKLIEFKTRTGTYEFKNNIGVDIEMAIEDVIQKRLTKLDVCSHLLGAIKGKYISPKKHNTTHCMTRYFNYTFMTASQFLKLRTMKYLEWRNHPDGVVVMIVPDEAYSEEAIEQHAKAIDDPCFVVCLPNQKESCAEKVKQWQAAKMLRDNTKFIEENIVIKRELDNLIEETVSEINEWFKTTYFPVKSVYNAAGRIPVSEHGLNRIVSDICDSAYPYTPIINHELINRHDVTAQILRARNAILSDLINARDTFPYENGTSAESTIYRATMIGPKDDEGLRYAKNKIDKFVASCIAHKKSFEGIISELVSPPIGMRRGVIPFYILDSLLRLENMPIIYYNNKEVIFDVEAINNLVKKPKDYFLYVEEESAQKIEYIHDMEALFSDFSEYCRDVDKRNQLAKITCMMQSWYRSLPQTSMTFTSPDYEGQNMKALIAFRKLLSDLYINPRDVLFVRIPNLSGTATLKDVLEFVKKQKADIDLHIHHIKKTAADIVRVSFAFEADVDLRQSLLMWYEGLPQTTKNSIFSTRTDALMQYIGAIQTNDDESIASRIVYLVTGIFIEDWKEGFEVQFQKDLQTAIDEIKAKKDGSSDTEQKILLVDEDGKTLERYYDFNPEQMSATASFFKSALDDMMEEYDGVLENNEKIGVLMDAIKKLMN